MAKLIKWLLGAVIFVLIVVVGMIVLLPMLIDPNDYKQELLGLVKQQTGRELAISKPLKLSVFPSLGIQTGGVTLSNPPKGFGDLPFAKVEKLALTIKLLPLLGGRIEADTLILNGLHLNLVTNKAGRHNWQGLAGKDKQDSAEVADPVEKSAGDESQLAFHIEGIQMRNGRVVWNDLTTGERYVLKQFRLKIGGFAPGLSVPVSSAFRINSKSPALQVAVTIDGQLKTDSTFNQIDVRGLRIAVDGKGEGLPDKGVHLETLVDIGLDQKRGVLDLDPLVIDGEGVRVRGALQVADINAEPKINGQINLGETNLRQLARLFGQRIETADPKVLRKVSGSIALTQDGKALKIDPLTLVVDDSTLSGHVHLLDPVGPKLRSDLVLDEIDLDRYLPPASDSTNTSNEASTKTEEQDAFEPLRTLDLVSTFKVGKLTANKLKLQDVQLKLVNRDAVLQAKPIKANLYQGVFRGEMRLDASGKKPKLQVKEKLTNLQIGPLLKDLVGEDRLLGAGAVDMDLSMVGLDERSIRQSLSGTASFDFRNGAYKGVNLAQLIRTGGGLLGKGATGESARTDFSELSGSVVINKGKIHNQDLSAKSPLLRVTGAGDVDLKTDIIDYRLVVELVASLEGQGGKQADKLTGVPVPVNITGQLTDPDFKPELGALLQSDLTEQLQLDQKKADLKRKLEQKTGGDLGKQLQNLFGQ